MKVAFAAESNMAGYTLSIWAISRTTPWSSRSWKKGFAFTLSRGFAIYLDKSRSFGRMGLHKQKNDTNIKESEKLCQRVLKTSLYVFGIALKNMI